MFHLWILASPVAMPATICVVESALVTMSKNIKTTANMLVISANGNFDSNSNKATV